MARRLMAILMLTLSLAVAGCEDDIIGDPPYTDVYLPQTSEDNVIENFQRTYRMRDIAAYSRLLAADYRSYPDPVTREQVGLEFWTRTEDSLMTGALFGSPEITKIVIELEWPPGSATNAGFQPILDKWTRLFLTDVYLDVDFAPEGQEVTTFRVENQTQRFFFRRGRTDLPSGPGDTLVYIVEWRDQGTSFAGKLQTTRVEGSTSTWSGIKSVFFTPAPGSSFLPQTSEDNVLENFQRAYRRRDSIAYERLLSNDFRFYFDPLTRDQLGIEYWNRTTDARQTSLLFHHPDVTNIVIQLEWPNGSATGAGLGPPRDDWSRLFLSDVFLDVDFAPVGQEVVTFRVEDQQQRFFFRRGRTDPPSGAGDTLIYIVEWRDQGQGSFRGDAARTSEAISWSSIKTIF